MPRTASFWLTPVVVVVVLFAHVTVQEDERIIGGTVVEGTERPSFLAVFNFMPGATVRCSSSVISPNYLISAAHCLVTKKLYTDGTCLTTMKKIKFKTVCEQQPNGDMKMTFPVQEVPSPEIYVNVDDLTKDASDPTKRMLVDFIITHKDGYKGGSYGSYGGYDVIIVKTRDPIPNTVKKICLPGPNYQFSAPIIGGYGRYRRVPCEVNDLGPNVYRFCKVDPSCTTGTKNFGTAQCEVKFPYNGKDYTGCIKDQGTPSSTDPQCQAFKTKMGYSDKEMQRKDINEIVLVDAASNKIVTRCFRETAGKFGWCGITDNIVNGTFTADAAEIKSNTGWGVCTDTCEDPEGSSLTGKARVKNVQIVDQAFCDEKLARTKKGKDNKFEVPPLVYCVAFNETYKTEFYSVKGEEYTLMPPTPQLHQQIMGRENPWYIRATGSCKGDSGGPLYEKKGDQFVLLGSTSRGTGSLSNCGGIDNPTHYVRMKDMLPWITTYVPAADICTL